MQENETKRKRTTTMRREKKKLIKKEIAVDLAVYSLYNVLMSNVE